VIVTLPTGPRGPDGLPGKMGADDFIAAYGEEAFRQLIHRFTRPPPKPRDLEEYRAELIRNRVASVASPGVYFDGSPVGAGKSYSDIPAAKAAGTSLTVLPVHRVCEETAEAYNQAGLLAAAYPELNRNTCQAYDEASIAIGAGLSASAAVCLLCRFSKDCEYRFRMEEADNAAHRIATHRRAELSFKTIADGCKYISIHEESSGLLRPTTELSAGLEVVAEIARIAGQTDKMDLRQFFWTMESVAVWLREKLQHLADTTPLEHPPACSSNPRGIDLELYRAMRTAGKYPFGDAVRLCKALAAGELAKTTIRVDRIFAKGGEVQIKKSIVAVWQTELPDNAAVWLSDATADFDEVQALAGRPVVNMTPSGTLETRHSAVQIPVDITQGMSSDKVVQILQAVMATLPAHRFGIIAHKCHLPAIKGTAKEGITLPEALRAKIHKIEYYHSGLGRGSNSWLDCDCLLVLGTPRVPPTAVRTRLIQRGLAQAAARDGEWKRDYWSGVTTSGKRVTVQTLAYRDHDWHHAHRAIVHAELLQAIGRGRGICPNGIPVVVVSNEPLGLPLVESPCQPLGDTAIEVLRILVNRVVSPGQGQGELRGQNPKDEWPRELRGQNPKYSTLVFSPLSSPEIAVSVHKDRRWVDRLLLDLAGRGLAEHVGQRGGWVASPAGVAFFQPPPSPNDGAAAGAVGPAAGTGARPEPAGPELECVVFDGGWVMEL